MNDRSGDGGKDIGIRFFDKLHGSALQEEIQSNLARTSSSKLGMLVYNTH